MSVSFSSVPKSLNNVISVTEIVSDETRCSAGVEETGLWEQREARHFDRSGDNSRYG
jgi:hypothetical protein